MNAENLIPIATSVGGGFFIGILLGYFVKKVIKVLMFVAGVNNWFIVISPTTTNNFSKHGET